MDDSFACIYRRGLAEHGPLARLCGRRCPGVGLGRRLAHRTVSRQDMSPRIPWIHDAATVLPRPTLGLRAGAGSGHAADKQWRESRTGGARAASDRQDASRADASTCSCTRRLVRRLLFLLQARQRWIGQRRRCAAMTAAERSLPAEGRRRRQPW